MQTDLDRAIAAVARRLRESTVVVHDDRGRGSGSGLVWDALGTIVTNAHVVRGKRARIETPSGRRDAELIARDPARDLAALRVEPGPDLVPAETRDSGSIVPGELAIAAGNPLGLVGAVTAGVVHRSNARWVVADVRLAPGNSGGPLADAGGRVLGINSMIVRGLAYAVPSSAVREFLGGPSRRRLGVRLAPARTRTGSGGLLVLDIEPNSVAERTGIVLGDLIVAPALAEFPNATSLEIVRAGATLQLPIAWNEPAEGPRAA